MRQERQKVRFGTKGVYWQERINFARMREERASRVRNELKRLGIAAAILSEGGDKIYATGVKFPVHGGAGDTWVMVFAEHPDPIVYHHSGSYMQMRFHCPWIKPENMRCAYRSMTGIAGPDGNAYLAMKAVELIKRDLEDKGLAKEKLGYDALPPAFDAALRDAKIEIVNITQALRQVRMIKTDDEINCMRIAGLVADSAHYAMIQALRPGIRECELAAVGYKALYDNSCDLGVSIALRSGPNTCPNFIGGSPTDRIIEVGDLVLWDVYGPMYEGYRTCYYRTCKVGARPTKEEKEWYKITYDMVYEALEEVKAGATTADVAKRWPPPEFFAKAGFDAPDEGSCASYAICHGVGLAQYELPLIQRVNSLKYPQPLEKGMTFAVETHFGKPFVGGCRLENMVVVTDTGYENLYTMPDEGIIVNESSLVNVFP